VRLRGGETGSGFCQVVGFGISGIKPSGNVILILLKITRVTVKSLGDMVIYAQALLSPTNLHN